MGKPTDPGYWRRWRAEHPEYRERERIRCRSRIRGPRDRTAENARRPSRALPRLELLRPDLQHGSVVSFWEDELRLDLAQERVLAELEGRDVDQAVAEYRSRELVWHLVTGRRPASDERNEAWD